MTLRKFKVVVLATLLAVLASCGGKRSGAEGGGSGGGASEGGAGGLGGTAGQEAPAGAGGAGGAGAAAGGSGASSQACDTGRLLLDPAAPALTDPGIEGDGDFTIGPNYVDAPELLGMAGVPRGSLKAFTISSTPDSIFAGVTGPVTRNVTVYVPSQYVAGTTVPFLVVQDGSSFITWLPATLDNLINDHRIPPMVAILINPGSGPDGERGLEYDTVSNAYVNFIENEVLPRVKQQYSVGLTNDPEGRAAMGWSSGGAAAFTMGWMCPSRYRRILTYSGTFVNAHPDLMYPHSAWEYHEHLIPESGAKPLRVFLEVGDIDNGYMEPESTYHNWMLANQRMAAVLKAKDYHYRFLFAANAGHIAEKVVRQTLPEALVWLWRGYPIE